MTHPDGSRIMENQTEIQKAFVEHECAYFTFVEKCRDVLSGKSAADMSELEQLARELEEKFKSLREAWGIVG
ncbi:hypothetical protein Y036_643 [Burkholderia pseudomallei]|uniref:Uncharacterized protein n=1 Tax=Burkholderia pseudomallei TaxID=28450 RepID=A0AA40MD66_BURPE|nr:hypothetical protein [Burkholderia pseudomallei]KGX06562.1 hypothetical protein Y036_643 [Burkholderia pseudomallei]